MEMLSIEISQSIRQTIGFRSQSDNICCGVASRFPEFIQIFPKALYQFRFFGRIQSGAIGDLCSSHRNRPTSILDSVRLKEVGNLLIFSKFFGNAREGETRAILVPVSSSEFCKRLTAILQTE